MNLQLWKLWRDLTDRPVELSEWREFEVTHDRIPLADGTYARVVTSTYRRRDGSSYTKDQTVWRPNSQVDWTAVSPDWIERRK